MFHIPALKSNVLVVFSWLFFLSLMPWSSSPNLFGTRDQFHGRQSFYGSGVGMISGWIEYITFFNWKIIILQCCISFCCAKRWTSHVYTYIPSLVSLPSTLPDPIRLGHHRDLSAIAKLPVLYWAKLPVLYSSFLLPGGTNWEIRINILIYTQPCALHLVCTLFLVLLHQLLLRSSGVRSRLPYGISEYFHYFSIASWQGTNQYLEFCSSHLKCIQIQRFRMHIASFVTIKNNCVTFHGQDTPHRDQWYCSLLKYTKSGAECQQEPAQIKWVWRAFL